MTQMHRGTGKKIVANISCLLTSGRRSNSKPKKTNDMNKTKITCSKDISLWELHDLIAKYIGVPLETRDERMNIDFMITRIDDITEETDVIDGLFMLKRCWYFVAHLEYKQYAFDAEMNVTDKLLDCRAEYGFAINRTDNEDFDRKEQIRDTNCLFLFYE